MLRVPHQAAVRPQRFDHELGASQPGAPPRRGPDRAANRPPGRRRRPAALSWLLLQHNRIDVPLPPARHKLPHPAPASWRAPPAQHGQLHRALRPPEIPRPGQPEAPSAAAAVARRAVLVHGRADRAVGVRDRSGRRRYRPRVRHPPAAAAGAAVLLLALQPLQLLRVVSRRWAGELRDCGGGAQPQATAHFRSKGWPLGRRAVGLRGVRGPAPAARPAPTAVRTSACSRCRRSEARRGLPPCQGTTGKEGQG